MGRPGLLLLVAAAAAAAAAAVEAAAPSGATPQQLRVVFGASDGASMVVCWVSMEDAAGGPAASEVQYGLAPDAMNRRASAAPKLFEKPRDVPRWMHNVPLDVGSLGLAAGRLVHYRVRSARPDGEWSGNFSFAAFGEGREAVTFAAYGDLASLREGIDDSSLPELGRQEVDFYLHLGDIAYNLDTANGSVGDDFGNDIQPFAARTPYMTTVGCHERDADKSYANYMARFAGLGHAAAASGSSSMRHYSFDAGPVHVASIDTDAWTYYGDIPSSHWLLERQYEWLEKDLRAVNRTRTPWVVLAGHRTMYCTSGPPGFTESRPAFFNTECQEEGFTIREGVLGSVAPLERLMMRHGVDLYLSGHTHHYERTWPVSKNRTLQQSYVAPAGPVHVLAGIAGVPGPDLFAGVAAPWTAFRDEAYTRGFGRITVFNASTLTYEFVSHDGAVIDSFVVQQELHGTFPGGLDVPPAEPGQSQWTHAEVASVSVICTLVASGAAAWLVLRRQRGALGAKGARRKSTLLRASSESLAAHN